ncbi:ABC transporter ATP-binding protein [Saliphagus sp. GCM10025334]
MLSTSDLSKNFSGFYAIRQVDFELEEGELHGLIGPNGAGKTTMFNLLTGELSPTEGEIRFKDEDITGASPMEITRLGIGRSFQIVQNFPEMTVREHLRLAIRNEKKTLTSVFENAEKYDDEIRSIADRVTLSDRLDDEVQNLSHGDKRFLEIGMVLGIDPELILLDEPAAGLNQSETVVLRDILREIRSEYTILLVDHDIELVRELSDRITVLHQGEILSQGSPKEIDNDEQIKEVYLGE